MFGDHGELKESNNWYESLVAVPFSPKHSFKTQSQDPQQEKGNNTKSGPIK